MDQGDAILKVQSALAPHLREGYDAESLEYDVTEFTGGWLVLPHTRDQDAPQRGTAAYTVDRQDGTVRIFPSAFPPRRIMENYDDLKTQHPALE